MKELNGALLETINMSKTHQKNTRDGERDRNAWPEPFGYLPSRLDGT